MSNTLKNYIVFNRTLAVVARESDKRDMISIIRSDQIPLNLVENTKGQRAYFAMRGTVDQINAVIKQFCDKYDVELWALSDDDADGDWL